MAGGGYRFQIAALVGILYITHQALTENGKGKGSYSHSKDGVHHSSDLVPHYKKAIQSLTGSTRDPYDLTGDDDVVEETELDYENQVKTPSYNVFKPEDEKTGDEEFEYESKNAVPEIFVAGSEMKENNGEIDPKEFTLHLIGERHSGTKWMSSHLEECFGKHIGFKVQPRFNRWKHWFQEDLDFKDLGKKAIVVAQFRNPYEWIKAMIKFPYHSPEHLELPWMEFVNRPWYMNPYGRDVTMKNLSDYNKETMDAREAPCQANYFPNEVVPCLDFRDDIVVSKGLSHPYSIHALYELRRDGSGKPYNNVLEMRADKIRNFVNMTNYEHVYHFEAVKYEGLATHGTEQLVRRLEKIIGVKADCTPSEGKFFPRPIEADLAEYLNRHMDWEAEGLIGYKRLDPRERNS